MQKGVLGVFNMTTLLEIIELMEIEDAIIRKDAEMMASKMANNVVMAWKSSPETAPEFIKFELKRSGYRTIDSRDYTKMKELPENKHFDFDPAGEFFERYFGITSLERKIEIPHQPSEDLITIGVGRSPFENGAYMIAASRGMLDRIKAVKGNEPINIPILYASIKGYIQIILPNNLVYSR